MGICIKPQIFHLELFPSFYFLFSRSRSKTDYIVTFGGGGGADFIIPFFPCFCRNTSHNINDKYTGSSRSKFWETI